MDVLLDPAREAVCGRNVDRARSLDGDEGDELASRDRVDESLDGGF
jgi:hypothetical protein